MDRMEDFRELLERVQASVAGVGEVQVGNAYGWMLDTERQLEWSGDPHSENIQVTFCGNVGLGKDLAKLLGLDPEMLQYRLQRDPEATEPREVAIEKWTEECGAKS